MHLSLPEHPSRALRAYGRQRHGTVRRGTFVVPEETQGPKGRRPEMACRFLRTSFFGRGGRYQRKRPVGPGNFSVLQKKGRALPDEKRDDFDKFLEIYIFSICRSLAVRLANS